MPTYNRVHFLERCLLPLFAQDYPQDRYEIILVDDGSTDDTVACARKLAQPWGGAFRIVSQPNGGPASARNAGFKASQAEIIAFIDSDCVAPPDWIRTLVESMTGTQAAGVGAPVVAADVTNWVARYMDAVDFYRHRVRGGKVDYLVTGNVAFRRAVLSEVGGFQNQPRPGAEDVELSFRIKQAGYPLAVINTGAVKHYGTPPSVRVLARNLYSYGRQNYFLLGKQKGGRHPLVEIIRHAGAIVLGPLLILRRSKHTGIGRALSFWPLVAIEHGAFIVGLLSGLFGKKGKSRHPDTEGMVTL
jgi:glycosyltransferase involved in cell wall biosynthesis